MLPAYGIPKAVAAALQALPAVALPVLRKIQGDRRTKNSPLACMKQGEGRIQQQHINYTSFFTQSVLLYRNPESWYGTDSHTWPAVRLIGIS